MSIKVLALGVAAGCLASFTASAIPLSDVGAIDVLIAQADLGNSGDGDEKAWVAGQLDLELDELVFEGKSNVTSPNWSAVDGLSGVWAFELAGPADWFLVKTGNIGGGQTNRHFLFDNLANLSYAVVRLADLGIKQIGNVDKISHVGEYNGAPPVKVPEPTTLSLLLTAIGGIALLRKRAKA